MERRVLLEAWQWQCCGEPFAVGDAVSWTVSSNIDREWLAHSVGGDTAAAITDYEDHHDTAEGEIKKITGRVTAISAAFCQYAPKPGGPPNYLEAVPGTAVFEPRSRANGWEDRDPRANHFVGYVVSLGQVQNLGKWPG